MAETFSMQQHDLLLSALYDEDHTVSVFGVGTNARKGAAVHLEEVGLLKPGLRIRSPFHDAYKLTREGLKVARRLEKETHG